VIARIAVVVLAVAGLLMPDWPEGARRAINFTMSPAVSHGVNQGGEDRLANFREAEGLAFDFEGD